MPLPSAVVSAVAAVCLTLSFGCVAEDPSLGDEAAIAPAFIISEVSVSIDPWIEFDSDGTAPELDLTLRNPGDKDSGIYAPALSNTYDGSWGPLEPAVSSYALRKNGLSLVITDLDLFTFSVIDACKLELDLDDLDTASSQVTISMRRDDPEGHRCINEENTLWWGDNSYRGNLVSLDVVLTAVEL